MVNYLLTNKSRIKKTRKKTEKLVQTYLWKESSGSPQKGWRDGAKQRASPSCHHHGRGSRMTRSDPDAVRLRLMCVCILVFNQKSF